ncbi:ArsR/SmtB family transcription factor [Acetivibrio cellulolyticus]|uniref:ArsR/SmtB family transcription factor n=1 Tax=Acetivibrio cellulolyticus TaxID=35830 RepID=UPI0001E2EB94|nr:metalloregulator ArsR/SmtB family transcription factor [Acetivibrio cellulolyticus]
MDTKKYSNIMKALSHPHRLELFLEIAKCQEKDYEEQDCLISEITKCFKIGAPTISHHLKELANVGLITTEKKGKFLVARINKEIVKELSTIFPQV